MEFIGKGWRARKIMPLSNQRIGGKESFPGACVKQVGTGCDRPGSVTEPAPSRKIIGH